MEESSCSGELSGFHRPRGLALPVQPANLLCPVADRVSRASQLLLLWPTLPGDASLDSAGASVGLSLRCRPSGSGVARWAAFAPRWDRDRVAAVGQRQ